MSDPLLIEGLVHHFDIVRSLAGSNAGTVHAVTWNPGWSEFQGHAQALVVIEMENGVKAVYEGAMANATHLNDWCRDYWRAECEEATLELDNRKLRAMSDLEGERKTRDIPLDEQDVWTNPWLAELFVEWLRGGDPPPNNLDDNIQCAALLFAAIESAHAGRIVDVQEYLRKKMAETEP
jgi:predicted dehydrogenase